MKDRKKEKQINHTLGIRPSLLEEVRKSADKNSDGNVNFEIRRLIKKGLEDDNK